MIERFAKVFADGKEYWYKVIDGRFYTVLRSVYDEVPEISTESITLPKDVVFLPPCDAKKVIALAYNYKGLIGNRKSYDEPLIFFKSLSGLIGNKAKVNYPSFGKKVWQEVELAVIIRSNIKNISANEVDNYIAGYTCGNDITCENILNRDWHLARSKGLDTFCPLGTYLVKGIETSKLRLRSFINDRQTQDSLTSDMILNVQESVALASKYFSLSPGDVILTGSPAGATDAVIKPGDTIKVEIESIGELMNYVMKG